MKRMPIAVAILLGILTAFACVPVLGFSSAIAAPMIWFTWARAHGVLGLALFLWDVVVVGGIGVGVPALVSLVVLVHTFNRGHLALVAAFVAALLLGIHIAVPLAYFEPVLSPAILPWWSFGKEMALMFVAIGVLASDQRHA